MIPPLLLQPIIENSIRHGVEKTSRACRIQITVVKKEEQASVFWLRMTAVRSRRNKWKGSK